MNSESNSKIKNNEKKHSFLMCPRDLFENPKYQHISMETKSLFIMILDRCKLSCRNSDKFTDENGAVYAIYTIEEICKKFRCGKNKAVRMLRELESADLIYRKRKLSCMPYRIYVTEEFSEFSKAEFGNSQNGNSRVPEIKPPELPKREHSNNNKSNNYISNNSSIIGFGRTEDEIREQIEYDCLVCDEIRKLLDEIVMIISDVLNGTSPTVRVGRDDMPRGVVISRFCKLDSEHILYVISELRNNTQKIRNMKPYLITLLYNAPATMENEATALYSYNYGKT